MTCLVPKIKRAPNLKDGPHYLVGVKWRFPYASYDKTKIYIHNWHFMFDGKRGFEHKNSGIECLAKHSKVRFQRAFVLDIWIRTQIFGEFNHLNHDLVVLIV